MKEEFVQFNHKYNIDETCAFATVDSSKPHPKTGKGALFRSKKDHDYFEDYIKAQC